MTAVVEPTNTKTHPLEPLSESDISLAAGVLRETGQLQGRRMVCSMALHEPDHAGLSNPQSAVREAAVTVLDRDSGEVFEAVVDLEARQVASWTHVPGVQPGMTISELVEGIEAVKAHPDYLAAMAARGITDLSRVTIDCWPNGHFGSDEDGSLRLTRGLSWLRAVPGGNAYAIPIEGVIAVIDLNAMEVVRIEDHGVVPLATAGAEYAAALVPNQREDIRPLEITQPEGASFEVDGHSISWQKWRIRFGFTHREGLVLHNVGYQNG